MSIEKRRNPRYLVPLLLTSIFILAACFGCSEIKIPAPLLTDEILSSVAENYLAENLFEPAFGGTVFCKTEVLGVSQQGTAIKAYVWALCAEYYEKSFSMHLGTAVSEPLMLYMLEFQGRYLATGFAEPRSGSQMEEDLKLMFPGEALERMCLGDTGCSNERVGRLEAGVEEKLRQFSDLSIAPPVED